MSVVEEINEPIDVVTVFREGRMAPVKLRWSGHTHAVERVAYRWVTRQGAYPIHHFSVITDTTQIYEIILNTQTMQWTLLKIHMQG